MGRRRKKSRRRPWPHEVGCSAQEDSQERALGTRRVPRLGMSSKFVCNVLGRLHGVSCFGGVTDVADSEAGSAVPRSAFGAATAENTAAPRLGFRTPVSIPCPAWK